MTAGPSAAEQRTPSEAEPADPLARGLLALSFALALLFLLPGITLTLAGAEGRWLSIARGMLRTGDPFAMRIGDAAYPDIPFASYWLIALTARLLGGMSEAAGRLPSVVVYLATMALTYHIGRRTLGARVGALGALLLACSIQLLSFGRSASADPHNMLGVCLAMTLMLAASERGRLSSFVLLGLVMGLTALCKGLVGIALPAFVAFAWTVSVRGWRWLSPLKVALAVVACLAAAGMPFLLAHWRDGGWEPLDLFWRESVVRALDPFDHIEPVWYYLQSQFEMLAPWSLLLPAALWFAITRLRAGSRQAGGIRAGLRDSEALRRAVFPLFGFVAVFVFFTLSRSRRSHYLMPLSPFAALLVAQVLLAAPDRVTSLLRRLGLIALGAFGTLIGLACAGLGVWRLLRDTPPERFAHSMADASTAWHGIPVWLAALGLMVVPAVLLVRHAGARRTPLTPLVLLLAATSILALPVREPIRSALDRSSPFAAAVQDIVPPGAGIALVGEVGAKLVYYLDLPGPVAVDDARYLIVPFSMEQEVAQWEGGWEPVADPRLEAAAWPDHKSDGFTLWTRAGPLSDEPLSPGPLSPGPGPR